MKVDRSGTAHALRRRATAALTVAVVATLAACGDVAGPRQAAPTTTADRPGRLAEGRDQPPGYADNTRWRRRSEPAGTDRAALEAAAEAVRRTLEDVRERGTIDEATVRVALQSLGWEPAAMQLRPFAPAGTAPAPAPAPVGIVFGLAVPPDGCIYGDVRPARVLVETGGRTAESGCIPPPAAH